MEFTRLGTSGLKVSRLGVGTMSFGDGSGGRESWSLPYEDAKEFFQQALELGITFWDTANGYGSGTSEIAVGQAVKELANRDDIVLATKAFFPGEDGPGGRGHASPPRSSASPRATTSRTPPTPSTSTSAPTS